MQALYASHDEAQKNLGRLIAEAKVIGQKHYRVAKLLSDLTPEVSNPWRAEAQILTLPNMEYDEALHLATAKAQANSIAVARKELADATETTRLVGLG